jgi:Putative adhesin
MRRRSLTGPILLMLIGVLFLLYNLRPDIQIYDALALYWPFLLIAWGVLRLLEVLVDYFRGRVQPYGFSGGEIVLIVFLCFMGWGAYEANRHGIHFRPSWEAFGEHYDYDVEGQQPAGDAKRVVFQNDRGNLKIVGAVDTNDIKVTGRKTVQATNQAEGDHANSGTPLEIVAQGDEIIVRTNQDHNPTNGKISEDLEVTIPSRMGVEAHGSYGDYEVSELDGNVDLSSDRADVRLNKIGGSARVELNRSDLVRAADLKGNLDLQGKGSDIELENVAGQVTINGSYSGSLEFKNVAKPLHYESPNTDLRVEALPGEISMTLGELTGNNLVGPIHLVTKSKDVKIEDFTESLELETDRGDIELEPKHLPLPRIEARSRTGQISLVLPDKAGFQLAASTDHGDAVNDFGPAIHKQTEGHAASLKGNVGDGPSIHLVTEHGTISVRKAGQAEDSDKTET